MMHTKIEDEEIIERYVRSQLAPEERRAFEEHFFSCDECFDKVQSLERFVAGLREAGSRGMLAEGAPVRVRAWSMSPWWFPAFGVSTFAALLLGSLAVWQYFIEMPSTRGELQHLTRELRSEQQARAALEQQLLQRIHSEANVPMVMLQATRDIQATTTEATLAADAAQLFLWIDLESGHYRSYRLEISATDGQQVETVEHLERNSYGGLAVSLPAAQLQPGEFRIKLFGQEPSPVALLAEYRLRIRRP
jgi:Putative zinc-finger